MFNLKSKKPVVIVEIGNEWLKIAESKPFMGDRAVTKTKFVHLSDIKGSVSDEIGSAFKSLHLAKQSVITCVPRHLVTVRTLELPSTDPGEINDMVNLQIGKQTPYSKEEIVSAHKIIDTEREGYIKVMLVIARRNVVTERVSAFEKNGIEIEKVMLSTEGAYDWFSAAYLSEKSPAGSELIAQVDIDANYSDFIVTRGGKLSFTRNIFIGAKHLSENPDEWREKFVEELRRSMERYQAEEKGARIQKIFLTGAAKEIKELDSFSGARLDIPTESADPVRNMRIAKSADVSPESDPALISKSALFGIALRHDALELDLTPPESRIHKSMEEKRKNLTLMGILFAAIMMMFSFIFLGHVYNKNAYLLELKEKISQIQKSAEEARRMRMRIDLVERRLDAKGSSIDILNEIHKLIPRAIHFTSIDIEEKNKIALKGRALAMSDVFKFVTTLESSPYFRNAKTTYTTTKKEEDVEYADFEIIAEYQN